MIKKIRQTKKQKEIIAKNIETTKIEKERRKRKQQVRICKKVFNPIPCFLIEIIRSED